MKPSEEKDPFLTTMTKKDISMSWKKDRNKKLMMIRVMRIMIRKMILMEMLKKI